MTTPIHPACAACKGACCESIRFPMGLFSDGDSRRWFSYHGLQDGETIWFACPCVHHGPDGLCRIYDTRPHVCRAFQVGGKLCRESIRHNRPKNRKELLELLPP